MNAAIDYCIENGILEAFLREYRSEVLGMLLEEFDKKKYERTLREEDIEEGIRKGKIKNLQENILYLIEEKNIYPDGIPDNIKSQILAETEISTLKKWLRHVACMETGQKFSLKLE